MRVRDNDETPVVVTAAPESEAVTEGEDAVFVLTRTGDLSSGLDVTFEVTGGDAVLTAAPPTGSRLRGRRSHGTDNPVDR